MYPVARMTGILEEIKPPSNPDYFMVIFNFAQEVFGKIFTVEEQPNPKSTRILCSAKNQQDLLNLVPGKKYDLTVSLRVNHGSEKDGKVYQPTVGYNIIGAKALG